MKPIDSIRKEWQCRFCNDCTKCSSKNICISATSFCNDRRRYMMYRLGLREPQNEAMRLGKLRHEEQLAHLKTVEQYGFTNIRKNLFLGKKIELQEVRLCSPQKGMRGVIDELWIMKNKDTINILAKEYKSGFSKKYFRQILAYGMMLADYNVRINFPVKKRKVRYISKPLYPQLKRFKLNIDLMIEVFNKKPRLIPYMKNNMVLENINGFQLYLNKLARGLRKLHKLNYYYLSELPMCVPCYKYCGYKTVCDKAPYIQKGVKTKQYYFGKKQMLIKSKPIINIARL